MGAGTRAPVEKVDGTRLTGVDYKTQGLSAIKDKPALKVRNNDGE